MHIFDLDFFSFLSLLCQYVVELHSSKGESVGKRVIVIVCRTCCDSPDQSLDGADRHIALSPDIPEPLSLPRTGLHIVSAFSSQEPLGRMFCSCKVQLCL